MKSFLFLICLTLSFFGINAQKPDFTPIEIGQKNVIPSKVLNESREVYITLPRSYSENTKVQYPILLIFDAEVLFLPFSSAIHFMCYGSEIPQVPEMIVVGIPNTDRQRDMPIPQRYYTGWGEEKFSSFLVNELLPYINMHFKTNGMNLLAGHSQGGLFVSYLLAEQTDFFSAALAMDAPVDIAQNLNGLKRKLAHLLTNNNEKRYLSIEGQYGWAKEWDTYLGEISRAKKIMIHGESHETMPFKGFYEGMKQLFVGFPPEKKDLKLGELKSHYRNISKDFGCQISIPERVLLSSAGRKVRENRKAEILELINYSDSLYGIGNLSRQIRKEAMSIAKAPDPKVDYYLSLPAPTEEEIQPFLGHWQGVLDVPEGTPLKMELKIEMDGARVLVLTKMFFQKDFVKPDFFAWENGRLLWGRKNRGGGLYVSEASINDKRRIEGVENLIGIEPPEGYSLPRNTFSFIKLE